MENEVQNCCLACASEGHEKYGSIDDRLFGSEGDWRIFECNRCQSLWLNPRPTPGSIGVAYERYYTHGGQAASGRAVLDSLSSLLRRRYYEAGENVVRHELGYPARRVRFVSKMLSALLVLIPGRKTEMLMSVMELRSECGQKSLDVGCGNGDLVERLSGLGWTASGIDLDARSVGFAQSRGLKVKVGSLSDELGKDKYDVVTMSQVIEHVFDPSQTIKQAFELLNAGGSLVVTTPNRFSWMHRIYGRNWLALDPPRHLAIFTPDALKDLALHAGFQNVTIKTTACGARLNWVASRGIKKSGRFDLMKPLGIKQRFLGEFFQAIEAIRLRFFANEGEDIFLRATK